MSPPYNPEHPALREPLVAGLEQYLSLRQSEELIKIWNDGWRMEPAFPFLRDGDLYVCARKRRPGGPDEQGVVWLLSMRVTNYGEVLDRKELDE